MDALPLHHDTKRVLARGWTTGRILNAIDWSDSDRPATISVGGVTKAFTYPPLSGRPETRNDEFGRVIETVLLAEFLAAAGERAGYDALMLLMALGSSDNRPESNAEYRKLNPLLVAHIEGHEDRGRALAAQLTERAKDLSTLAFDAPRDGEWQQYPDSVATAKIQSRALLDLAGAIERHLTSGADSGPGLQLN